MQKLWRIRKSWPVLAIGVFYIYLTFHALSGSQGLMSWVDYENDIARYNSELSELRSTKKQIEFQIESLRADNLNRDYLDIRSRESVFLSHPNEVTIWLDP